MPHVEANGIRIFYEMEGEGPFLVTISGFTQHHLAWSSCLPILTKHFRVLSFDNRGAGQSDAPEESYSIELFAKDTVALLDTLEIESAHFLGSSMGTLIIQELCLTAPERVMKGVLCAPFSYFPPIAKHNVKTQLKMLSEGVPRERLLELNMAWLLSNQFLSIPSNKERFMKDVLSDPYPISMEGLLGQVDALFNADLRNDIHKVPHQLLLLVGERDIDTPLYCAEEMNEAMPNSHIHIFKEMGHMFHYEIPEKLSKKAIDFLLQK